MKFDKANGCCAFDFRAVFEDGTLLQTANVSLCETGDDAYTE